VLEREVGVAEAESFLLFLDDRPGIYNWLGSTVVGNAEGVEVVDRAAQDILNARGEHSIIPQPDHSDLMFE